MWILIVLYLVLCTICGIAEITKNFREGFAITGNYIMDGAFMIASFIFGFLIVSLSIPVLIPCWLLGCLINKYKN